MNRAYLAVALVILFVGSAYAVKQLAPLHGVTNVQGGDLLVRIYDANLNGNKVYDSGSDYNGAIQGSGAFNILVGDNTTLDLNSGTYYYMAVRVNNSDLNFGVNHDNNRFRFESPIGNDINASSINFDGRNAFLWKSNINTERMRLTADGNLGIGNTAPFGKLNVIGDVNILTSGAAIPSLYISPVDGNIAIAGAAVTAGYRLDVNGNIRTNGNLLVVGNIVGYVSNSSFKTYFDGNSAALYPLADVNVADNITATSYLANSFLGNLFPVPDANVADNITAINYLSNSFLVNLFPVPDVNILSSVRFNQDASCDNNINCKGAGYIITDFNAIFTNDVNALKINSNTLSSKDNNSLSLQTLNITRLIILSDGSIGIGGDTTPDYNLEVGGTFAVSSTASANADRLIVASDGNVGIATSTPRNKLNVIGDFNVIKTGGIGVPSFYIVAGDGNVGIGTTTPRNLFNMTAGDANFAVRTTIANDLNINKGGASGVNISADSNKVCLGSPCNHFIDFNGTTTIIQ